MRLSRPLAAVVSALLIGSLGSAGPSGASALAGSPDIAANPAAAPVVPGVGASGILPGGQRVKHPATAVPGKRQPLAADPHTVLVKLKPSASAADRARLLAAAGGRVSRTVTGGYLKVTTTGLASAAMAKLRKDSAVASAEPDRVRHLTATPNDTFYAQYQKYLTTIRMPQAWGLRNSATGAVVAVVDTGVDTTHADLTGRLVAGYNAVANSSNVTDSIGHGTFVAGIIAANTDNKAGIASVTWNGRVMPVKVFNGETASDSDIAEGIAWAVAHGAKVINLSLGGPGDGSVLRDAINAAYAQGVVVVAAAGNTGDSEPQFPASYPNVISVGATDNAGGLTDFSSFGSSVDIAAPGFDVFSTFPRDGDCVPCYAFWSGTSFSAPQVAGVAALMKAKYPAWNPAQITKQLMATARDAGPRGRDPYYGAGLLDAYAALGGPTTTPIAMRLNGPAEPNDVPARAYALNPGAGIVSSIDVEGDADWYKVAVPADGTLTATAIPPSHRDDRAQNMDAVLDLYDAQLHLVAHADSAADPWVPEQISLLVPKDTYYLKVTNFDGAAVLNYSINVGFTPVPVVTDPPFLSPTNHTSAGEHSDAIAAGDVSGDGRPDVVMLATSNAAPLQVQLLVSTQAPDGSFTSGVYYPAIGNASASGVAVLDATGDGKLDAVAGTPTGVEVHAQNGSGTLDPGVSIAAVANVTDLTTTDFDHDGDQDVIASGDGIFLLTQGPAGVFTSTQIATSAQGHGETEVGDLDADGRLDVASLGNTNTVAVHLNKTGGWTHQNYAISNSGSVNGIAVADVSGDGKADLVATGRNASPEGIDVFRQQAGGTLAASQQLGFNPVGCVETVDGDGDGRTDLLAGVSSGPAFFFPQQADGTFNRQIGTQTPPFTAATTDFDCMVLVDLNGDSRVDVVSAIPNVAGFSTAYSALAGPPEPGIEIPRGAQQFVKTTNVPDFAHGGAPAKLTVTAPMALNPSSVTPQTVQVLDSRGTPLPVTVTYDAQSKTISIYRLSPLSKGDTRYVPFGGQAYRVVIGAVKDSAGNVNPGYSYTFSN